MAGAKTIFYRAVNLFRPQGVRASSEYTSNWGLWRIFRDGKESGFAAKEIARRINQGSINIEELAKIKMGNVLPILRHLSDTKLHAYFQLPAIAQVFSQRFSPMTGLKYAILTSQDRGYMSDQATQETVMDRYAACVEIAYSDETPRLISMDVAAFYSSIQQEGKTLRVFEVRFSEFVTHINRELRAIKSQLSRFVSSPPGKSTIQSQPLCWRRVGSEWGDHPPLMMLLSLMTGRRSAEVYEAESDLYFS